VNIEAPVSGQEIIAAITGSTTLREVRESLATLGTELPAYLVAARHSGEYQTSFPLALADEIMSERSDDSLDQLISEIDVRVGQSECCCVRTPFGPNRDGASERLCFLSEATNVRYPLGDLWTDMDVWKNDNEGWY